jgi:excisionase family DNA binding protein
VGTRAVADVPPGEDAVILGEDGPLLLVTAREAFILREGVRKWTAEHERFGARQKLTAVRPLLERWETVADAHAATLTDRSANGHAHRTGAHRGEPLGAEPISTNEAADLLGVSARQVRRLIAAGELAARTVGRSKLVDPQSVQHLRQLRSSA